jgi:hypothetical protein
MVELWHRLLGEGRGLDPGWRWTGCSIARWEDFWPTEAWEPLDGFPATDAPVLNDEASGIGIGIGVVDGGLGVSGKYDE